MQGGQRREKAVRRIVCASRMPTWLHLKKEGALIKGWEQSRLLEPLVGETTTCTSWRRRSRRTTLCGSAQRPSSRGGGILLEGKLSRQAVGALFFALSLFPLIVGTLCRSLTLTFLCHLERRRREGGGGEGRRGGGEGRLNPFLLYFFSTDLPSH